MDRISVGFQLVTITSGSVTTQEQHFLIQLLDLASGEIIGLAPVLLTQLAVPAPFSRKARLTGDAG